MATLSGEKIKDKFGNLLQVEGGIDSSTRTVEDGLARESALKLSTTTVEIDGDLKFTAAPTTDNSETTALLLDNSTPPKMVKRELSSLAVTPISPSTGTTETAAILIDASGNPVQRDLATTAFKQFPRILARAYFDDDGDKALAQGTPYKIVYAPIDNNSGNNSFNQDDGGILTFLNSARKIVNIGEDGVYKISISLFLTDCANTIISTNITKNPSGGGTGVILCEGVREKSNATSKSMISFYTTALLGEDDGIEVNIECTSGTATLKGGSTLDIEKIA